MPAHTIFSSINGQVDDYAHNSNGIRQALENGLFLSTSNEISFHVLSAMALTGTHAQAYNSYRNSSEESNELLSMIRNLMQESSFQKTNSTTLLSFPWYYRDTNQHDVNHPFYYDETNPANNRPFYATAIIQKGNIVKIHLESHLEYPNGGPYDKRYFAEWPMNAKPVVIRVPSDEEHQETILVGSFMLDDNTAIVSNLTQAKAFIVAHPETTRIIINAPGYLNHEDIKGLSQSKGYEQCTIIFGSPLGSDSGEKCTSSAVYIYKNGVEQYSTPQASRYSFEASFTQVVSDYSITESPQNALFEIQNDVIKASALWLRDYLLKTEQQGFVISMSDGLRSAYTLLIANLSIDLAIQAYGGVRHFLNVSHFGYLNYKNKILDCSNEQEAIRLLKSKLLICIYMPVALKEPDLERAHMKKLVEAVGASFRISDTDQVVNTTFQALNNGLRNQPDKQSLLHKHDNTLKLAAHKRAQATLFGMVGNMENMICLSNASATDVAYGRLNAGGEGQNGPISITLPLFETQISHYLANIAHGHGLSIEIDSTVLSVLKNRCAPLQASKEKLEVIFSNEELVIEHLIIQRKSAIQTYHDLKNEYLTRWDHDNRKLLIDIDNACRIWSVSQPSRVALAISPNLGTSGKNLDRYSAVRNTRNNQYFHNGRVALKLEFLREQCPNEITDDIDGMIAESDSALRDYLLCTEYQELDINQYIALRDDYKKHNEMPYTRLSTKKRLSDEHTFSLNVGVASLYQTIFDYSKNKKNIKDAIYHAENQGIDVLLMPELCLTGYFGDGDFDWIRTRDEANQIERHALDIAQYAKHSDMIISIGLPVLLKGHSKPFIGQALLHHGKIISISLKTTQPDGDAEFEAMHFTPYDINAMGITQKISILGQDESVIVGKPVILVCDKNNNQVPIIIEQCAEAWWGVNDNDSLNKAIQMNKRYLNTIAKKYANLLVLNPSGSKNDIGIEKTKIRQNSLARKALEDNPTIAGYAYVNVAGHDNGTVGGDSDNFIIARESNSSTLRLHHGRRHTLNRMSTSSMVISIARAGLQSADLIINQETSFNRLHQVNTTGVCADFDLKNLDKKKREYTEAIYGHASWILDTLRHHKKQCFIISLSGGADSAYGAVQIVTAIDLFIKEYIDVARDKALQLNLDFDIHKAQIGAIEKLFEEYFAHLSCKQNILDTLCEHGAEAAIKLIKDNILICVYMSTDNSSKDTRLAAKTLIEGGPLYMMNSHAHKTHQIISFSDGIGGQFLESELQQPMEEYIISYVGKSDTFQTLIKSPEIIEELERQKTDWPEALAQACTPVKLIEKIITLFSEKKLYDKTEYLKRKSHNQNPLFVFPPNLKALLRESPPTWWYASEQKMHDLTKQNMQSRLRSISPWLLAELYEGLPLFTSNLSEAAAGYSTWAGDTSLGYENILGGIFKTDVNSMLLMFEKGELCGLNPIKSLYYVNHLKPSAELRPLNTEGKLIQTDEADLMPYHQLDAIIKVMFLEKNTPWQTYIKLKDALNDENMPLFESPEQRLTCIHTVCRLYQAAQYKRTGGGNTCFTGNSLEPHSSLRTPIISKTLTNLCVKMNLKYLAEQKLIPYSQAFYLQIINNPKLRHMMEKKPILTLYDYESINTQQ